MADRDIEPGLLYEADEFGPGTVADLDATGCRFVDCAFGSWTVVGGDAERSAWRGSRLRGVRFTGVGLAHSQWLDTQVDAGALSGCEAFGAQLRRVHFEGCLLDSVNLRDAVLRDVSFTDCVLRHVDLGHARLTDVRFAGCTVQRLDLTGATLSRVDLRGSTLEIAHGIDRLRGAVIDHGQLIDLAPALAAQLGMEVRAAGQ